MKKKSKRKTKVKPGPNLWRLTKRELLELLAEAKAETERQRLDTVAFEAREREIAEIRGDRAAIRGELLRIKATLRKLGKYVRPRAR